jgi:hypothetical protein
MNKMLYIAAVISFTCCKQATKPADENTTPVKPDYSTIQQLNWLEGTWRNESKEGLGIETWSKQNDSVFSGKSFFIIGKDTVSSETISLEQRGKEVLYIPVAKGQNDGKPVTFPLTKSDKDQWIFENPEHDFPTKISYTRIGQDSLLAEISGIIEGKASSQKIAMGRR